MYLLSSIVSEASALLLLCTAVVLHQAHGLDFQLLTPNGDCKDGDGAWIDYIHFVGDVVANVELCNEKCAVCHDPENGVTLSGLQYRTDPNTCVCFFLDGKTFDDLGDNCSSDNVGYDFSYDGNGVETVDDSNSYSAPFQCYKVDPTSYNPTLPPAIPFQLLTPNGDCRDGDGARIDYISIGDIDSAELCKEKCTLCHDPENGVILSGVQFTSVSSGTTCECLFPNGLKFEDLGDNCRSVADGEYFLFEGNGVETVNNLDNTQCFKVDPTSYNPTRPPAIPSWVLEYKSESLVADFNRTSVDEITVTYKIGKDRNYDATLLKSGCEESEIELTDDDGIDIVSANTEDIGDDPENTYLHLGFNVTKNATVLKDVYYAKDGAEDKTLNLCLKLQLLNSKNEEVKSDKQELSIEFMFNNTFEIDNIELSEIYVGSDTVATQVLDYVTACACTSSEDNVCSDEPITGEGDDDRVNVCIWSTSDEMEIDYLDRLVMNGNGEEMVIVDGGDLKNPDMSSRTYAPVWNGVHAASIVKSDLYSYDGDVLAKVTGVVYLQLAGSTRRRIAVELTGGHESEVGSAGSSRSRALQSAGDQESAFAVNVALQKSELELGDAEVNGAVDTFRSGFIVAVAGFAAAMMM